MFFIIICALRVSGGFSAHHQEPIKLYVQPWVLSYFPAIYLWCGCVGTVQLRLLECINSNTITLAVDSSKVWQYPRLHLQFYKLLIMGGKTARNM